MKIAVNLLVFCFLICSAFVGNAIASEDRMPVELHPAFGSTQAETDAELRLGPVRDPNRDPAGPHDIYYDNNEPQWIIIWNNYFSKVIFTPERPFTLQAVRFRFFNPNNVGTAATGYIYRMNQQNNALTDLEATFELRNVANNQMFTVELPEEDYVDFGGGEMFAIVWGRVPGGDQNQGGQGWWSLTDDGTQTNTSFMVQEVNEPPAAHNAWTAFDDGDFIVRANGTFGGNGADLAVLNAYPSERVWTTNAGVEAPFTAQISNPGNADVEGYLLTFNVKNKAGEEVWNHDIVGEFLGEGSTITVDIEEPWIPETAGHYSVNVGILPFEEDIFPVNNEKSFEIVVLDVEDSETWLGFIEAELPVGTNWQHEAGEPIGVVLEHPGGELPIAIKGLRSYLVPQNNLQVGTEVTFSIFKVANQRIEEVWTGMSETTSSNEPHWVEVQIPAEEYVTYWLGETLFLTCNYVDDLFQASDNTAPVTGAHPTLESVSIFRANDQWFNLVASDIALEFQVAESDEIPQGAYLRITPEVLDFGYELELDTDHEIVATFSAYGSEDVRIQSLQMTQTAQRYFRLSESSFDIAAGESVDITVFFRATERNTIFSGQLLIQNTSQNMRQHIWPLRASTEALNVKDMDIIPTEYSISQNYPNPFNATTTINISVPSQENVSVNVFDLNGKMVKQAFEGVMSAGSHSLTIEANELPAGIYLYKVQAGNFNDVRKMVLLK